MTNGKKFKSAEERRVAYKYYCEECGRKHKSITDEFGWLELEYKEALNPCPFCGGKAELYLRDEKYAVVKCTKCGGSGGGRVETVDAIIDWNRRVKRI